MMMMMSMDVDAVRHMLAHRWKHAAQHWGPTATRQDWLLRSSTLSQEATRALYYKLHEEEERGGWGSACEAALGKMEYHVPSCAALTWMVEQALAGSDSSCAMSDCALKCGIRH